MILNGYLGETIFQSNYARTKQCLLLATSKTAVSEADNYKKTVFQTGNQR